jgi:hypothetical protein
MAYNSAYHLDRWTAIVEHAGLKLLAKKNSLLLCLSEEFVKESLADGILPGGHAIELRGIA